ncbi:MAG: serine protease [Actinoplanes sp.]
MSIVAAVVAALALAGAAGVAFWTHSTAKGRVVGTWVTPTAQDPVGARAPESAADGRSAIGEVVQVGRLLGYGSPQRFRYAGATYVKVHFSSLTMQPGDFVTVSDAAGGESYRYSASAAGRWAMSITGDTAVVEVHGSSSQVKIDKIARGFSRPAQSGLTGREESLCGGDQSKDAVCYRSADPVAYTRSKAIARLLINGTELCTGWRVGAGNRMLTNHHCFSTSADAYETEVWFNYQCAKCGGYNVFRPTKVWGDKVVATDATYDYTLFTVENFRAVRKFGYLTLDPARPARKQELYIPQHPAGEPTRIAGSLGDKAGTCAVVDPASDGYAPRSDVSYYCDTEGGSSGSPVLSRKTHKVVAIHHFGGCPNSGVRGDLVSAKIKSYL